MSADRITAEISHHYTVFTYPGVCGRTFQHLSERWDKHTGSYCLKQGMIIDARPGMEPECAQCLTKAATLLKAGSVNVLSRYVSDESMLADNRW